MKLRPIASNMTELELVNTIVLFSYKTPVACCIRSTGQYFKTSHKWSKTTSRHINKWIPNDIQEYKIAERPQEYFDDLVNP